MTQRPSLVLPSVVANGCGKSIARDLSQWLQRFANDAGAEASVTVAAGYLSIHGLLTMAETLRTLLDHDVHVRVLFGVAPTGTATTLWESRPPATSTEIRPLLLAGDKALRAEIGGIPMSAARAVDVAELLEILSNPKVQIRRYERSFFHPKAVIAHGQSRRTTAVVGSFNLTRAGLISNIELGVGVRADQGDDVAGEVDAYWNQAKPYPLEELVATLFLLQPPELVYLRMLSTLFGEELAVVPSPIGLAPFQDAAVAKAVTALRHRGGVLLADDTGLGKSYQIGALIRRETVEGAGSASVLLVVPAHLRPMWEGYKQQWNLHVEIISYDQLCAASRHLRRAGEPWPIFTMVVFDESHYLNNPRSKRRRALEHLLSCQPKRPKIVLSTATPVNNCGSELASQLHIASPFPEEDRPVAHGWEPWPTVRLSRKQLFEMCKHATALPPWELRLLHAEIDALTVRRNRTFIKATWASPTDDVNFPTVRQHPVFYRLSDRARDLFVDVLDAATIGTAADDPEFQQAMEQLRGPEPRVQPLALAAFRTPYYALADEPPPWVHTLPALMKSMMLKRIESSIAAFASTAAVLAERTRLALADLDERGRVRISISRELRDQLREMANEWLDSTDDQEDQDAEQLLRQFLGADADFGPNGGLPTSTYHSASRFDRDAFRADLSSDLNILTDLADQAAAIAKTDDAKAKACADLIDTLDDKTACFAGARETTADLGARIHGHIAAQPAHRYANRVANIGTSKAPTKAEVARVLAEFCPKSAIPPRSGLVRRRRKDSYDLLFATDAVSEGVNLQQARVLINYDLPWALGRIAQRIGRLDRYGSPHTVVDCYTFLPDQVLDAWLRLMDKLIAKTETAAALIGVSTVLFPGAPTNPLTFTSMFESLTKPDKAQTVAAPRSELRRVWVRRARDEPLISKPLEEVGNWSGAIHPEPADDPIAVFCFSLDGPAGNAPVPILCAVAAGKRLGWSTTDATTCLEEIDLDPESWIEATAEGAAVSRGCAVPASIQELVFNLHETARSAVAVEHELDPDRIDERLHLVGWMLRPDRPMARRLRSNTSSPACP